MQQRTDRSLHARQTHRVTPEKNSGRTNLVRPRKSLTEESDDLSGKRPTKTKVLVVYRTGFVRSGVLSIIAKSVGFAVCSETTKRFGPPVISASQTRSGSGFEHTIIGLTGEDQN
jgi:hypothetical protein